MRLQFRIVSLLFGVLMLSLAACSSSAQTTNQTSPTSAPAGDVQPTIALAPTQSSNGGDVQPTKVTSALPTQTAAATLPTAAANNAPPASGSSAFDLIANAMRAQASAKSFRSTIVTTTDTGATSSTVIEYVAPDRLHTTRTSAAGTSSETIVIKGQGSWQKLKGTWTKSPVDLGAAAFAFLDPKIIEQMKSTVDIGTVQLIGPDLLGTTPTFAYQYNQVIKGVGADGVDLNGSYKVWVGVTDQRVYKVEGDSDSPTKPGAKIHSVNTYEYDINIQIQPPV